MLTLLTILLGLIIGSLLNAIIAIFRTYPANTNALLASRSRCSFCEKKIRWFDNVPCLSWIWLRGKCRDCGGRISPRYPAVEVITAAIAAMATLLFGLTPIAMFSFILGSWLLVLAVIDWETGHLPDTLTITGMWVGLLLSAHEYLVLPTEAILGAAVGYVSLWLVNAIYAYLRGKDGIGRGDFKLLAMLGAWLGAGSIPMILAIGAGMGAIWHSVSFRQDDVRGQREIPFGPWLALGGFLTLYMMVIEQ